MKFQIGQTVRTLKHDSRFLEYGEHVIITAYWENFGENGSYLCVPISKPEHMNIGHLPEQLEALI